MSEKATSFSCWVCKNYGRERCTSHSIGWKTLNQLVLEDIRRNALEARRHVGDYIDMLLVIEEDRRKEEIERCRRELKKADKRMEELTPYVLNELIEKIVVYEKVIGRDGVKTQQVDIYYKFIGLISPKAEGGCSGEVIKTPRPRKGRPA